MTDTIRWGIAGRAHGGDNGGGVRARAERELVAVGSRSLERAQAFATEHGIPRAHGSYEALAANPEIDAVYIATPHTQHTDIALAVIEAGKALLVEKSFSSTVEDTQRIIDAARARGTFAMEAMWTRFNPAIAAIRELIAAGEIGELRAVHGDLTAFRTYDPSDRLFNPETGGGVILDLGVYVISFAEAFLGVPDIVHTVGSLLPNGVEGSFSLLFGYDDGRSATLSGAFTAYGPGRMALLCTQGWIDVHPRFHRTPSLTVWRGKEPDTLHFDHGYQHEVIHVGECLAQGLTESPIMPLDDTIAVQRLMQEVLDQVRR